MRVLFQLKIFFSIYTQIRFEPIQIYYKSKYISWFKPQNLNINSFANTLQSRANILLMYNNFLQVQCNSSISNNHW